MATRIKRGGRGIRMEQHGCVLSEILSEPGATQSVFDVLAAAVQLFSPGRRVAMLGFAGGGVVAPLRKAGGQHVVHGVDLSGQGYRLYRRAARNWGGEVCFDKQDAMAWLRGQRSRFDAIVEDLSIPRDGDVVKPAICWEVLPGLMKRKLRAGGVIVTNLLPTPGISWRELLAACRTGPGVVVEFERFYNRVVIQGRAINDVRLIGKMLRLQLQALGSETASAISIRTLGA